MKQLPRIRFASRAAFTLVELLVVLAVVILLSTIALSGISKVRDKADAARCASNLRSIGSAFLLYANDFDGYLPLHINSLVTPDPAERRKGWQVKIMPYMMMDSVTVRSRFICPSADPRPRTDQETTYAISMFLQAQPLAGRIENLTSSIVLVADAPTGNYDTMLPWNYSGYSNGHRLQMFRHDGGTRQNAAFSDGSVRSMSGIEGGAFRGEGAIPNAWVIQGMGYVNNGFQANPSAAQNFSPN